MKDCLQIFTDVVFPDKNSFVENVSLSHQLLLEELMTWQQILKTHWPRDSAGAPVMTGKQNGFATLLAKSVPHEIIAHHCIIHQENLCGKTLENCT